MIPLSEHIKDNHAFSLLHQDFSQILVSCLP